VRSKQRTGTVLHLPVLLAPHFMLFVALLAARVVAFAAFFAAFSTWPFRSRLRANRRGASDA
jgi:hypothetical protein